MTPHDPERSYEESVLVIDKCPCRFNDRCDERRQAAQHGWLKRYPEEVVFGPMCPYWDANVEAEYYEIQPDKTPEQG